jgi:hypothetical protein
MPQVGITICQVATVRCAGTRKGNSIRSYRVAWFRFSQARRFQQRFEQVKNYSHMKPTPRPALSWNPSASGNACALRLWVAV